MFLEDHLQDYFTSILVYSQSFNILYNIIDADDILDSSVEMHLDDLRKLVHSKRVSMIHISHDEYDMYEIEELKKLEKEMAQKFISLINVRFHNL